MRRRNATLRPTPSHCTATRSRASPGAPSRRPGRDREGQRPGRRQPRAHPLSGYFTWLAREGYVSANPVAYTNKAVENGAPSGC